MSPTKKYSFYRFSLTSVSRVFFPSEAPTLTSPNPRPILGPSRTPASANY